jgi:CHRD domain
MGDEMSSSWNRKTAKNLRLLAFAAALSAASALAFADVIPIEATLRGADEAPPNDSSATGRLVGTLDTDTNTLEWTVAYSGLTSPALSADFHGPAPPGENAPIQVATPGALASPFNGVARIDATQANDLKDGRWYFNLHSKTFPAGEIRGPVTRR